MINNMIELDYIKYDNGLKFTSAGIKYMMKKLGIMPENEHRLPMMPATPELETHLDAVLERAGLLKDAAA